MGGKALQCGHAGGRVVQQHAASLRGRQAGQCEAPQQLLPHLRRQAARNGQGR